MQAAVQAVAKLTGQSGVDYLVKNAGTAGLPVLAHEEYKLVKHSCISLAQEHCSQPVPSTARPSYAFQSTSSCICVCMDWIYMRIMRCGAQLGH